MGDFITTLPDYTSQSVNTYKTNIDNAFAELDDIFLDNLVMGANNKGIVFEESGGGAGGKVYQTSTDVVRVDTGSAEQVEIKDSSGARIVLFDANTSHFLQLNDSTADPQLRIYRQENSLTPGAVAGRIRFYANNSVAGAHEFGRIEFAGTDFTDASEDGYMSFLASVGGTAVACLALGTGYTNPTSGSVGVNQLRTENGSAASPAIHNGTNGIFFGAASVSIGVSGTQVIQIDQTTGLLVIDENILCLRSDGSVPALTARRDDAHGSGADVGYVDGYGEDSASNNEIYGRIKFHALDNTSTSEDGRVSIAAKVAGVLGDKLHTAQGTWTNGATGGDPGADAINASGIYEDGVQITAAGNAKTWVHYDQVTGATITDNASLNVTSLTDTATGRATITIDTDFASANYAVLGMGEQLASVPTAVNVTVERGTQAAGTITIETRSNNALFDFDNVYIAMFGAQ